MNNIPEEKIHRLKQLFTKKNYGECLKKTDFLLQEYSNSPVLHNIMGLCKTAENRFDDAMDSYKKAIFYNPDFAEAHYNMARNLFKNDDYKAAILNYKKAIKLNPKYSLAFFGLGNVLKASNEFKDAIEMYEQATKISPDFIAAFYNLANSYKTIHSNKAAIRNYEMVISLNPRFAQAYNNMGTVLNSENYLQEAISKYKIAINIRPLYSEAWFNMANSYNELGDIQNAISSYEKSLEIKPNYTEAHFNIGRCLLQLTDLHGALKKFKSVASLNPQYKGAFYYIGLCFYGLKEYSKAASYFKVTSFEKSQSYFLRCLYLLNMRSEFSKQLDYLIAQGEVNAMVGSLVCRTQLKYKETNTNLFCADPMSYIFHRNVFKQTHFKKSVAKVINKLFTDVSTPFLYQSLLINGMQTAGNIFANGDNVIKQIHEMLIKEIDAYREQFSESDAGFLRNWPSRFKLYGWLVKITEGGSLKPHMHENGWISGSIYIKVPKNLSAGEGNLVLCVGEDDLDGVEGNLKRSIGVSTGSLCLFPASLLHYTTPFRSKEDRIVLAFDVIPI